MGNYSTIGSGSNYTIYEVSLNAINETFAITYDKNTTDNQFAYTTTNGIGYYHFQHYLPFDYNQCTFGNITKVMNDSSITYNEFTNLEKYPNGIAINETGKFFNDEPEDFILEYVCNNNVIKDSLNAVGKESFLAEKIWANDKILDLTQNKTNTYSYYYGSSYEPNYSDIIITSMDYRVLSFYTAFLALPQEDTVEASLDNNSNYAPVSIYDVYIENISFKCFPNPFKEKLNVEIEVKNNIEATDLTVKIIDISGREIYRFKSLENQNNKISLFWNGRNSIGEEVNSGVYFIVAEILDKTYTFEILKD